jgi:hypothetical protein
MTDFASMTDDELNEWIAYERGWTSNIPTSSYTQFWISPTTSSRRLSLPKWTNDLNAAWKLFAEMSQSEIFTDCELVPCGAGALVRMVGKGQNWEEVEANKPARAICLAWCMWRELQK